ncbi:MAG: hypothetical protein KDE45_08960, partial [Caldilineaceae bacterium]|nr:hypothetical protein [Caldilineaceae bacterium]
LPDDSQVPVVLNLDDGHGGQSVVATSLLVRRSDLARSSLLMQPRFVEPGGLTTLTIFVQNTGHRETEAQVELTGLANPAWTVGAPSCSTGDCALVDEDTLVWTGTLAPRNLMQIRLPLQLSADVAYGDAFDISAVLTDLRWGEEFSLTDRMMVAHNLFMPSIQTTGPESGTLYLPLIR